jgi:hypothetical protein
LDIYYITTFYAFAPQPKLRKISSNWEVQGGGGSGSGGGSGAYFKNEKGVI